MSLFIFGFFLAIIIHGSMTKIEVTSGIYLERLPNISFYQSTRQVIFRLQKPQNILDKLQCRVQFCSVNRYICDQLLTEINYFNNFQRNPTPTSSDLLLSDGELFDFQLATRNHLKKIFASEYEINVLLSKFSKRDHVRLHDIPFPNLLSSKYNISCTDPQLKDLVLMELQMKYDNSRMLVSMCQLKRLIIDFVPLELLSKILTRLILEVTNDNYVLALGSLTQLYTMPLVECIMSEQTILVGVHIPLLKRDLQELHMMKVLTPPYAWNNYTCSVDIPVLNVALQQTNSTWKIFVPRCDPIREELCYISDYRDEENLGISCVQQTLKGGSFRQFATNCPISCRETGNDSQFVTPLSSHRTLVTHPKHSLRLKCDHETHDLQTEERIGALSINIPCSCYLEADEDRFSPIYPCVDKLVVVGQHQMIPAAWTHYTGLSLPKWGDPALSFEKLSDCLDTTWIINHFPEDTIPLTTYFLIALYILVFLLFVLYSYLINYHFRSYRFNRIQRITTPPMELTTIRPTSMRASPTLARRPLPELPIQAETQFAETEDEYLQPIVPRPPIYSEEVSATPSTSTGTTYEPHPTTRNVSPAATSTYVRMDKLMTIGNTRVRK